MRAPPVVSTRAKMRSRSRTGGPTIGTPLPVTGNYTIEFSVSGRQIVPPGTSLGNITPVATISWALGGNQFVRKVSVFEGATITGCAEHVTVTLSDETDPLDLTDITDYSVAIAVAEGVRGPTGLPPVYQTYLNHSGIVAYGSVIIAASDTFEVDVPQGAGVNSVMVTQSLNALSTLGSLPNIVVQQDWGTPPAELKSYEPQIYTFVPIAASCKSILLVNNDTEASCTFSVTWGIDG